jgi:transposase
MAEESKRRHFTNEYKKNAVKLVTEKGLPVSKVARDLDIHPQLLHQWRKKFFHKGDSAFVGKGNLNPEDAEMKKLRKKLAEVEEERDIFKKALAVFSKQQG